MGDYALAMNGRQTLRNPFEDDEAVRLREKTVFGNPYQTEKKMSIDEEDEASTAENRQPSISVEGDRIDAASASDTVSSDTCSVSSSRTARSVRQSLGGSMRKARLKSTSLTMQIMRVAVIDRVPSLYHIPSILAYPDGTREAEENGCHLQKELGRLHEVHRENQRLAAEQAAAATAASVNVWREGVKVKSAEPQKMTDPSTSLSASSSMSPYGDSHPELLDHAYTLPESSIDPPTLFAPIVSHDPLMDLDSDSESLTPSATSPSSTTASSLVLSSYPSLSRKRKLGSSLDSSLSLLPSNNQIEVAAVASAEISNSSKEIPDTMVMKLDNLGRDEILLKISRLFRQCSRGE